MRVKATIGVVLAVAVFVGLGIGALAWDSANIVTAAEHPTAAIAVLTPTQGNNVTGTVKFTQTDDGVKIEAHINGLSEGKHGFHIHEFGDISAPDGTSAGGHFNPAGHDHGAPTADKRHVGDLGNLDVPPSGHAMYERIDKVITLHGDHSILGRAVVVHAGEDDLKTQPTGDAGGRVAVGVIGVAKAAN